MIFSRFTKLCNHPLYLVPKHFTQKETCEQSLHTPLPPAAGNHQPALGLSGYVCSGTLRYVTFYDRLLHLPCFQGPSMVWHGSEFPPFYGEYDSIVCMARHVLLACSSVRGHWTVSAFWRLLVVLRLIYFDVLTKILRAVFSGLLVPAETPGFAFRLPDPAPMPVPSIY